MISKVRKIAKEIVDKSCHVEFDINNIFKLSKKIKDSPISEWKPSLPKWYVDGEFGECEKEVFLMYELLANSVNYCYWYGKANIRPLGANSVKMYRLLDEVFSLLKYPSIWDFRNHVDLFYQKLVNERFPLLEERYRHTKETVNCSGLNNLRIAVLMNRDVGKTINCLVNFFPGYASDMFLKRAQLFVMQVQRGLNIFSEEEIKKLTVPADYHIPKMLRYYDCIHYFDGLSDDIKRSKLIPKGSIKEIEIRAATIVSCDMLADMSGTDTTVVDDFLWQSRKECTDPFHLTITTDY